MMQIGGCNTVVFLFIYLMHVYVVRHAYSVRRIRIFYYTKCTAAAAAARNSHHLIKLMNVKQYILMEKGSAVCLLNEKEDVGSAKCAG